MKNIINTFRNETLENKVKYIGVIIITIMGICIVINTIINPNSFEL